MSSPHILGTDQPTAETPADLDSRRATPKHTNGLVRDPTSPLVCWGQLNRGHADGLRTFGSLLDLELDTLVFLERPKAAAADLGEVDEDILRPIVRSDKTEALVTVEPLHSSLRHLLSSLVQSGCTKHPRAL